MISISVFDISSIDIVDSLSSLGMLNKAICLTRKAACLSVQGAFAFKAKSISILSKSRSQPMAFGNIAYRSQIK